MSRGAAKTTVIQIRPPRMNDGRTAPDDLLQELVAKQAITEVLHRYCRGIDRMDREAGRRRYGIRTAPPTMAKVDTRAPAPASSITSGHNTPPWSATPTRSETS